MFKYLSLVVGLWGFQAFAETPVHHDRNEAEYNYQYEIVLNGYDPVSYFPEGGGSPLLGDQAIAFTYGARTYYFANSENQKAFMHDPLKYEPSYGSWCAYGMAHSAKIKINPTIFTINGKRIHFFVGKSAKANFDEALAEQEVDADSHWKNYSGEEPRF